jgi:plasmid stabilization system protein ParE
VARVLVTPRALDDLQELTETLGLPESTLRRVQRSLRILERFPLAGRALGGRWAGVRFLIGPWPWLIVLYVHDVDDDAVYVVAAQDGRGSTSATRDRA